MLRGFGHPAPGPAKRYQKVFSVHFDGQVWCGEDGWPWPSVNASWRSVGPRCWPPKGVFLLRWSVQGICRGNQKHQKETHRPVSEHSERAKTGEYLSLFYNIIYLYLYIIIIIFKINWQLLHKYQLINGYLFSIILNVLVYESISVTWIQEILHIIIAYRLVCWKLILFMLMIMLVVN